ncbi:MAG: glutamine-hydrolyzing carbamoyl-phosphate synthase small subunit [Candidatus Cyclobacteriaceae bacterium M2_1C_046]
MKYTKHEKAYLLLEDGMIFEGYSIGKKGTSGGEVCFNTGMTGYQEIYTDPSYYGQIVVNTTAHIGNYGAYDGEQESSRAQIAGLVVDSFSEEYSRKTATESLQKYLEDNDVVGIAGIDTRQLVRHIRKQGAMNGIISSALESEALKEELKKVPSMKGLELSTKVTIKEPYIAGEENTEGFRVAVLDLGIKTSIITNLLKRRCICKVFPAKTTFEEMEKWNPDGYFVSNGPGDPASTGYAVETVKAILDKNKPFFGICLGHQLLALACGISTYKLHHGHRGLNHPVKNLISGRSEMTSQNHGFSITEEEVMNSEVVEPTHLHLNDKTISGIKVKGKNAFSVQYHPESSPGPNDSKYLFDDFIKLMKSYKK